MLKNKRLNINQILKVEKASKLINLDRKTVIKNFGISTSTALSILKI